MRDALAKPINDLRDQGARLRHGNQLTENNADARLVRVPSASQSESWITRPEFMQEAIGAEVIGDQQRIRIQIKHLPHALRDGEQQRGIINEDGQP